MAEEGPGCGAGGGVRSEGAGEKVRHIRVQARRQPRRLAHPTPDAASRSRGRRRQAVHSELQAKWGGERGQNGCHLSHAVGKARQSRRAGRAKRTSARAGPVFVRDFPLRIRCGERADGDCGAPTEARAMRSSRSMSRERESEREGER